MSDFRPITCLNTVYKVVSKLLAARLKAILPPIISHCQSAFMPGRLLLENILLATEIVQGYNKKNISPRAMLKVDLRKAFDTVSWDFILSTLRAINCPDIFIGWIYQCLTTASFSISVNGHTGGFFRSSHGLRQGDPMSPYLFVLVMEVFSGLLRSRYTSGYIAYHPRTSQVEISHLMFADDVMVFFDGASSSLHGIYETLDDFAGWSGLHMNREKTKLFHAGLSHHESTAITSYGFKVGSLPIKYLGLPLMSRKLKISEYAPLIEKISSRFTSWAVRSLSFAGRVQLLASVISGIVNFWISAFILPLGCIRQIESLCSRFLWSGSIDTKGMAKVKWSQICLPRNEGGLGLRRFGTWNRTLCLRMIWLLFSNSGSLWVAWHKYHNCSISTSFWIQPEKSSDSWNWRCILRLRCLAENFVRCKIGDGKTASFWFDHWTPFGPLIKLLGTDGPRSLRAPLNAKVADLCNSVGWTLAAPRTDSACNLMIYLTSIDLPTLSGELDVYDWVVEDKLCNGFSSAKTWAALRPRSDVVSWAKTVWFKGATPKHAFHMWVTNLDRLPTKTRLASWGMQLQTTCGLCSLDIEDRDHLFLTCEFACFLWHTVSVRLELPAFSFVVWNDLMDWTLQRNRRSPPTLPSASSLCNLCSTPFGSRETTSSTIMRLFCRQWCLRPLTGKSKTPLLQED
ncbi:putative RNA-directed DNA polymerase [Arabidopsis thaliana]